MKNRIRDYLSTPRHNGPPSKAVNPPSRQLPHGQYVHATHEVESYVIKHPLLAIGAVFSIGVFLAWMIKRK
jgi:ElaB/YqjD/DUF883 family membrane-anchored ribosome-binding protein